MLVLKYAVLLFAKSAKAMTIMVEVKGILSIYQTPSSLRNFKSYLQNLVRAEMFTLQLILQTVSIISSTFSFSTSLSPVNVNLIIIRCKLCKNASKQKSKNFQRFLKLHVTSCLLVASLREICFRNLQHILPWLGNAAVDFWSVFLPFGLLANLMCVGICLKSLDLFSWLTK